jgi:hypothetical protein
MTGGREDDPLMARLRALPGVPLPVAARARALARAEAELARRPRLGWSSRLRWLGTEALVPTVLVMAGLLYVGGALRGLIQVYGPRPPASIAAVARPAAPAPVALGVPDGVSVPRPPAQVARAGAPGGRLVEPFARRSPVTRRAGNNGQVTSTSKRCLGR